MKKREYKEGTPNETNRIENRKKNPNEDGNKIKVQ